MLMAGLDGIENKIDPGEPLDKDIYGLGPQELKKVPSLPGSLEESLRPWRRTTTFLLKGDVFTEDVIETWIEYKRENEIQPLRLRPHPYEYLALLRHLIRSSGSGPRAHGGGGVRPPLTAAKTSCARSAGSAGI